MALYIIQTSISYITSKMKNLIDRAEVREKLKMKNRIVFSHGAFFFHHGWYKKKDSSTFRKQSPLRFLCFVMAKIHRGFFWLDTRLFLHYASNTDMEYNSHM